jgi:hypothetical protein
VTEKLNYPPILIPAKTIEDLAAAMKVHVRKCQHDHSGNFRQVPIVDYNPAFSCLKCRVCAKLVYLTVPPSEGGTIDIYICSLLKQQQEFFDKHFASCVLTQAVQ